MGWAAGFDSGSKMGRTWIDTYLQAKQQAELAAVADAKPEQSQGFTADQGQQLEAIANARDANGQPYYSLQADPSGQYTVTPNFQVQGADGQMAPAPAAQIAQQGVTDFMGQRQAGAMSEAQVSAARQRAMAGVLMKTDPRAGAQMLRDVTAGEREAQQGVRDEQRFVWEGARAGREDRQGARAEATQAAVDAIDQDVATWTKGKLTQPDGTQRPMTPHDLLESSQYRVSKLVDAGKLTEATALAKENTAMTLHSIQANTAERNAALGPTAAAVAGGDLNALIPFYKKFVPDGAEITGITKDPKSGAITIERQTLDGKPLPPTVAKSVSEILVGLKSFEDPAALATFAQREFENNLQLAADKRAEKSLDIQRQQVGIQGAQAAAAIKHSLAATSEIQQKTTDRKELADIHTDLTKAIGSGDKEAEKTARDKLLTYTIGAKGTQHMSALEQNANLILASGKAKTMSEAIDQARTKVQSSPKDDFLKMTTGATPLSGEQLESAMQIMHGANWRAKVSGETGPQKGQEQVIQAGANKGKTAVFDGHGWVLKP